MATRYFGQCLALLCPAKHDSCNKLFRPPSSNCRSSSSEMSQVLSHLLQDLRGLCPV